MVRTKLLPHDALTSLTIQRCKEILALGRGQAASVLATSRKRAAGRIFKLRQKARERGYREGLAQGRKELEAVLTATRQVYLSAMARAEDDCFHLSSLLAEAILEEKLPENAGRYRRWIREAVQILADDAPRELQYHPSLQSVVGILAETEQWNLQCTPNDSLAPMTMFLTSASGGVEFAWKEALQRLQTEAR